MSLPLSHQQPLEVKPCLVQEAAVRGQDGIPIPGRGGRRVVRLSVVTPPGGALCGGLCQLAGLFPMPVEDTQRAFIRK